MKEMETILGLKYEPDGLMYHKDLRSRVYLQVSNMIRDWMHILLNSGVANSQMFELMMVLKKMQTQVQTTCDPRIHLAFSFAIQTRPSECQLAWGKPV